MGGHPPPARGWGAGRERKAFLGFAEGLYFILIHRYSPAIAAF